MDFEYENVVNEFISLAIKIGNNIEPNVAMVKLCRVQKRFETAFSGAHSPLIIQANDSVAGFLYQLSTADDVLFDPEVNEETIGNTDDISIMLDEIIDNIFILDDVMVTEP